MTPQFGAAAYAQEAGYGLTQKIGWLGWGLNSRRGSVGGLKLLFDRVESHVVSGDAVTEPVDLGDFVGEAILW